MPSPFPGMNPYLERPAKWDSFHPNFISTAHFQLAAQVRPRYLVSIETRLYIHEPPAENRFFGTSDLGLTHPPVRESGTGATSTLVAPMYVTLPQAVEVERVGALVIRDRDGDEVVTVIELLSRANKYAGPDREQYLAKRREVLRSPVHFVEIDLLRGGPRTPPNEGLKCDYCAIVSRAEERPRAGVWAWRLRDPLPVLPIPLRDSEARLDLKAAIDRLYDEGVYAPFLYDHQPEPPLRADDAAWASQFVPPATPR
ncbi:MAG: DUF4058 family protein [Gemmataceae bacterium]